MAGKHMMSGRARKRVVVIAAGIVLVAIGACELVLDEPYVSPTTEVSLAPAARVSGFGYVVRAADFDGDGIDDLVVSNPLGGQFPRAIAGDVHVLLGPIADMDPSVAPALVLRGQQAMRFAGTPLRVGDLNGDGQPDVIASAVFGTRRESISHALDPAGGTVYAVDGGLRGEHELEASAFLTVQGPASMGRALAVGDWNGDGWDDLMVGCPLRAAVYVVLGPRTGVVRLPDEADVTLFGPDGSLGSALAVVGGNDLAVTDYVNRVIYLVPSALTGRHAIEEVATTTIRSGDREDLLGGLVAGDVGGDGREELVVVAGRADAEDRGTVFVLPPSDEGERDVRRDSVLTLTDLDRGRRRIDVAVGGAWLAIGLSGRTLLPTSDNQGEAWLIRGDLRGQYALDAVLVGESVVRIRSDSGKVDRFGTDVLFAQTQAAGRWELVVSATGGPLLPPARGEVTVYRLPDGE